MVLSSIMVSSHRSLVAAQHTSGVCFAAVSTFNYQLLSEQMNQISWELSVTMVFVREEYLVMFETHMY